MASSAANRLERVRRFLTPRVVMRLVDAQDYTPNRLARARLAGQPEYCPNYHSSDRGGVRLMPQLNFNLRGEESARGSSD